jgi:K(+)-stimulated pyrophosphate-energized sodium pump
VKSDEAIAGVLATLASDKATTARISGYHDASGNPDANEEIARARAETVMGLLVSRGVEPGRIVLDKPMLTTGDGSADEARRVEVLVE